MGASGSGKSTLASLLTRTWDPASGTVTIGGTNVAEVVPADLRATVAYAPQRPYLFNDTLRANLLLAAPDATEEDLESALEAVDLTDWLATEKDGLDTVVGDMGERLSGGQRQRLALARALLRDAPIYVFDEATSQVDPATEARVREGIARVADGRAPSSRSPTASAPCATPTRSSSWTRAASSRPARTPSCTPAAARSPPSRRAKPPINPAPDSTQADAGDGATASSPASLRARSR